MVPLEICCRPLAVTEVVIAVGTEDKYTCEEFARLLEAILRKTGPAQARVSVRIVEGASHEVTMAESEEIRHEYLGALFD